MNGYGLALGGGGSRGAYQLGVWRALREMNIKIDIVVGTSIGAINGAFICEGNYSALEKLWTNATIDKCFDINNNNIESDNFKVLDLFFILKNLIHFGGLNITPLKNLVSENINEDLIRKSPITFGLVTICISTLKPLEIFVEDIPKGELVDYIMASASLPGFKKHTINEECYIDGGLYNNVPSIMLERSGCNKIIEVDIEGPGIRRKLKNKDKINLIEIKPRESLGSILSFHKEQIERNIELGYLDTLRAFNKIKGLYYYFYKVEIPFEEKLYRASLDEIQLLFKAIDFKDTFTDKFTFFRSLRTLKGDIRNLVINTKESMVLAMEITADMLKVEKCKLYTKEQLLINIIFESKDYSYLDTTPFKDILSLSHCNLLDHSPSKILFRRTLAIGFPKEFIAHMFLSIIKYRFNL